MNASDTDYETKITLEVGGVALPDDVPFNILLLGNWSGVQADLTDDFSKLKPTEINRDNFEDVMGKLAVKVDLDFGETAETRISLEFRELDDFHPDQIFQRLPLFSDLRDIRQRLVNPKTYEDAAREVRSWIVDNAETDNDVSEPQDFSAPLRANQSGNLLDEILGQGNHPLDSQSRKGSETELDSFINNIVKPHLIHTDTDEQSNLLVIVDEIISDSMRKILHHPEFQSLESAWRGLYFMIRRTETSTDLKIFLLNISQTQLADNLKSVNSLTDSEVYKVISQDDDFNYVDNPWTIIGGDYNFALNVDDAATLIRLAEIAGKIEAPFISSIAPEMFGFKSFGTANDLVTWNIAEDSTENKLWTVLRSIPEAANLGLTVSRFLSRLPYGEKTDPTETFYFEEFSETPLHENYLWSNSIFIIVSLLAQTYSHHGWDISKNFSADVSGMLIHNYQEDTELKAKSSTEIYLSQSKCNLITEQGLMPLISFKDTDAVRIMSLQSIAYPTKPLNGRWK